MYVCSSTIIILANESLLLLYTLKYTNVSVAYGHAICDSVGIELSGRFQREDYWLEEQETEIFPHKFFMMHRHTHTLFFENVLSSGILFYH